MVKEEKEKEVQTLKYKHRHQWKKALQPGFQKVLGHDGVVEKHIKKGPRGPKVNPEDEGGEGETQMETFSEAYHESMMRVGNEVVQVRDVDSQRSVWDQFAYHAENAMAQHAVAPFLALALLFVILVIAFGFLWWVCLKYELYLPTSMRPFSDDIIQDDDHPWHGDHYATIEADLAYLVDAQNVSAELSRTILGELAAARRRLVKGGGGTGQPGDLVEDVEGTIGYHSLHESMWASLQILAAAGIDDSIPDMTILRVVYFAALLCGLVVFAILVGFITDSVTSFMDSLGEGRTKVVTYGHTLVLGTNEATPRLVSQVAHMRRQYIEANGGVWNMLLWWKRVPPSTPLATASIVVMSNTMEKRELDGRLLAAAEADKRRTRGRRPRAAADGQARARQGRASRRRLRAPLPRKVCGDPGEV